MMRLLARLTLVLVLVAGAVSAWAWHDYTTTLESAASIGDEPVTFTIERGWSARRVSRELAVRDLIDKPWWFDLDARLSGRAADIRSGEYVLEPGTAVGELIDVFVAGRTVQYSHTIVEGSNIRELLARLATVERLEHELPPAGASPGTESASESGFESGAVVDTVSVAVSVAVSGTGSGAELGFGPGVESGAESIVMAAIGHPDLHPEGQFFADTYRFPAGTSDIQFLARAKRLLDQVLAEEWEARDPAVNLATPYEALILASIVEKETAVVGERPLIAGVFLSRLEKGMRLQTDPTVIYGIGTAYDGNIRRRDLTTDTPYNTYTRAGLPPTPIAMVGREAIRAVLHPESTSSLYFVARGDGTHQFSETLADHEAAVRKFQLKR